MNQNDNKMNYRKCCRKDERYNKIKALTIHKIHQYTSESLLENYGDALIYSTRYCCKITIILNPILINIQPKN
jgi:hypothetical protein